MSLPLNRIIEGDCIENLRSLPGGVVDVIFADPPYNLRLQKELYRPNMTKVAAVKDAWDKFDSPEMYDEFTCKWLTECKRVLKPTGTIWVIGTYHNIFRVGKIMQDLGFWILNDVIWIKTNPMPNFRGVRFTNAHETLIWASTKKDAKYTFNYQGMKGLNDEKQMRSDWWFLSPAAGKERIRNKDGGRAHSTQKPEALLYRVILSSSNPGDIVLDPFFGSGTTGAVAKRLHRNWIGLEEKREYIDIAQKRIEAIKAEPFDAETFNVKSKAKTAPRVPFSLLLENGYLRPGQRLFFAKDRSRSATVKPDGRIRTADGFEGSIHQAGRRYKNGAPCNGWTHWYLQEGKEMVPLNEIRKRYRATM